MTSSPRSRPNQPRLTRRSWMRKTGRSSERRKSASGTSGSGATAAGKKPPAATGLVARLPQRTCVACRTTRAKRELVRVVRSPAGELSVDLRGKAPGRGAYLDPDEGCLERGITEGALARALETPIDAITADRLRVELAAVAKTKET